MTYPHSQFSPEIHDPQGPEVGGEVFLLGTEKRQLPTLVSLEEVLAASVEARILRDKQEQARLELEERKRKHKDEIKAIERRIQNLEESAAEQDAIAAGYHAPRPQLVELRANKISETVHIVRTDTGQEIDRRTLYASEVQAAMPDMDDQEIDRKLRALMGYLPAQPITIAMDDRVPYSADEIAALINTGKKRGWIVQDADGARITEEGEEWRSGLHDDEHESGDDREDFEVVTLHLSTLPRYTGKPRSIARALGDGWSTDRVMDACDVGRAAGWITGDGGERAKRTLTDQGVAWARAQTDGSA